MSIIEFPTNARLLFFLETTNIGEYVYKREKDGVCIALGKSRTFIFDYMVCLLFSIFVVLFH